MRLGGELPESTLGGGLNGVGDVAELDPEVRAIHGNHIGGLAAADRLDLRRRESPGSGDSTAGRSARTAARSRGTPRLPWGY